MGYDITVKNTKFHRWFSVWDWHRCIASVLFGLGEIDDDEYRDELYAVNDLQRNGLPKDDNGERVSMADIKTKIETKEVEKTIVEVNIDYDDELRAIGAAALIPVPAKMVEAKDFDAKQFAEMIGGTVAIQVRTNNLLHDHKEGLRITNEDCQRLSSMEGEEIRREMPLMLAMGLGSCLEKISAQDYSKDPPGSMRQAWTAMLDDMEIPQDIRDEMFEPLLRIFDICAEHELSFEITEYLDAEQMASIVRGLALAVDAFFSGSTITIE